MRFLVDGTTVVLRPRDAGPGAVRCAAGDLTVAHVRSPGPTDGLRIPDTDDWVMLSLEDGAGDVFDLVVDDERAEGILELLETVPTLTGPPRAHVVRARRPSRFRWDWAPPWAAVLGAVGTTGILVVAALWLIAQPVVVTVTGPADEYDYCPVTWVDPWDGRSRAAEISCWDEQPGDRVQALALEYPFRGEVFDLGSMPALLYTALTVVAVAVGGTLLRMWRRRRRPNPYVTIPVDAAAGVAVEPLEPPPVDREHLDLATVHEVAQTRAVREHWKGTATAPMHLAEALQVRWWRVPALRGVVSAGLTPAAAAVVPLLAALVGGWTAWGGWTGTLGSTEVVTATTHEVVETIALHPDDLEVSFTTTWGAEATAVVAVVADDVPATVQVRHAVDDPTRARVVGPLDGTPRGMLLSGAAGAGGLLWIAWWVRTATTRLRRLSFALRCGESRDLDYVLVADPEGVPVLLVYEDPGHAPGWALPLAEPVLAAVPLSGRVHLRGRLADDADVVPVVADRVLWPLAPIVEIDDETAYELATGDIADDELDDDPPHRGHRDHP